MGDCVLYQFHLECLVPLLHIRLRQRYLLVWEIYIELRRALCRLPFMLIQLRHHMEDLLQ
jgi:hypothetical protein